MREGGREGGRDRSIDGWREHPPHPDSTVSPALFFVLFVHGGCLLAAKIVGHRTSFLSSRKEDVAFEEKKKKENKP